MAPVLFVIFSNNLLFAFKRCKGVHVQSRTDDTFEDMKMIVDSFGLMVSLDKSDCAPKGSMKFVHKTFGHIMQSARLPQTTRNILLISLTKYLAS